MRTLSRRAVCLAAGVMLLAAPVAAQTPKLNLLADKPGKTQDEIDAEKARQKAYEESLKKIPDGKPPADPWGNVRSDAPASPKTPTKSASSTNAAKAKTKSSAPATSGTSQN